jgi:hypothetical protein
VPQRPRGFVRPSHLVGHRMSRRPFLISSPIATCSTLRLGVALPALMAIGLSLISPVLAQWAPRTPTDTSANAARPSWAPNRPSLNEVADTAPIDRNPTARNPQPGWRPRPSARVNQASHETEGPAFGTSDDDPEEIPAPAPIRDLPLRIGGPRFEYAEPFADEGLSGPCDDDFCDPYSGCADLQCRRLFGGRFWGRAEYLLWWTRGANLPPLATTSPAGTTPLNSGVLGRSDTTVLFGGGPLLTDVRSGGRVTIGYLLDACNGLGIEANYLRLCTATGHFQADSSTVPILARPYFDLGLNTESALLVSHPDFLSGSVAVNTTTDFQGAGVLFRKAMWQGCCERFDFLFGYRYVRLDDELAISQSSLWTREQGIIPRGTTKVLSDSFDTDNQFNGGELGLSYRSRMNQWSLEIMGKAALGNTFSEVRVNGSTLTTLPDGRSAAFVGGLLAQETNIGAFQQNKFSVIPEVGVTLGCNVTQQLRATVGYTFVYWNNVLRPGDQIDRSLSQLPPEPPTGALRPAVPMKSTNFWAQGINLGLDYCF